MKTTYPEIEITLNDLKKIIYFIFMKYKADSGHMGSMAKSDMIGGFIDRWVNRLSEFVVFNHFLKDKEYKVAPDYFLYDSQSEKDASDLLGLECNDGRTIPFIKYDNGSWKRAGSCPRIEIKTTRQTQHLLSVRDTQMNDDFYVFVESKLNSDYISALFKNDVFSHEIFQSIKMDKDSYVQNDSRNLLISPFEINPSEKIGTVRLIGTYKKDDFVKFSVLCSEKKSVRYLVGAGSCYRTISSRYMHSKNTEPVLNGNAYINNFSDCQTLPVHVSHSDFIIIGSSNSSLYIQTHQPITIDGCEYPQGVLKLEYQKMERTSNWIEYMTSKTFLGLQGNDATSELLKIIDDIYHGFRG